MLNETLTYIIPMSKKGDIDNDSPVEIKPRFDKRFVICEKDGYETKYFCKEFFEWLIYRKYIKIKGE